MRESDTDGDIRRMSAPPPTVSQQPGADSPDAGLVQAGARGARPRLEELQRLTSALVRLSTMEEIGVFTIENGKILREEFFYIAG